MLMICFSINPSVPIYHMLKYSRISINYPSGQIRICCLLIPPSVSVCYCQTNGTPFIRSSHSTTSLWSICVPQYKYLGVIVSQNLCWSHHIEHISCRARKILCIIYRNVAKDTDDPSTILRLYMALVRPHLEYAAQVWNPHLVKDIHLLEKVQKFALRLCKKNYNESYQYLLDHFQIPSLQDRRLFLSLCTFYCILNKFMFFPTESVLPPTMSFSNSRNFKPYAYRVPLAHHKGLKFSFLHNTISVWNNLPPEAINSQSLANFKHCISPLFLTS